LRYRLIPPLVNWGRLSKTLWRRLRVCRQMAERSLLIKADGDARAGTWGKRWATFRFKSAYVGTLYSFVQLKSIAAEAI